MRVRVGVRVRVRVVVGVRVRVRVGRPSLKPRQCEHERLRLVSIWMSVSIASRCACDAACRQSRIAVGSDFSPRVLSSSPPSRNWLGLGSGLGLGLGSGLGLG